MPNLLAIHRKPVRSLRSALYRFSRKFSAPKRANEPPSLQQSLEAAYRWICEAQDANPDYGVAALYDVFDGWSASYPETTGYIIPTLATYSQVTGDRRALERALRMADWESEVQLSTGAVRSGTMAAKVGPAVFNTGQVLFGWATAYQATQEKRYAESTQRAADWLLQVQDDDGAWRRELSLMTHSRVQTYNVRSAWGLALAGKVLGEPKWCKAACRNADWVLTQQRENGWFAQNGFTDGEAPLLHTIGYALEGLEGMGSLLGREEYVQAARKGIRPLVSSYEANGKLAGRYDPDWKTTVSWRCLTGEAQIALVLLRLARRRHADGSFASTATRILDGLTRVQSTGGSVPAGGLAGSDPIWGDYVPYSYLNWAIKFFMDALLIALFDNDVADGLVPETSQAAAMATNQGTNHGV